MAKPLWYLNVLWTDALTTFFIHLYHDHAVFKKLSGYHDDRHHVYRPNTRRELTFTTNKIGRICELLEIGLLEDPLFSGDTSNFLSSSRKHFFIFSLNKTVNFETDELKKKYDWVKIIVFRRKRNHDTVWWWYCWCQSKPVSLANKKPTYTRHTFPHHIKT